MEDQFKPGDIVFFKEEERYYAMAYFEKMVPFRVIRNGGSLGSDWVVLDSQFIPHSTEWDSRNGTSAVRLRRDPFMSAVKNAWENRHDTTATVSK